MKLRDSLPAPRSRPVPARDARALTAPEFHQLGQVPPAAEWFANIDNPNTRRAYRNDLKEFMTFVGISSPENLRLVTRAHVLACRKDLERRELTGSTIRRKLAALSSLFEYLSDANAVTHNPVKGVRRHKVESYEGKTPALGDAQAIAEFVENSIGAHAQQKAGRRITRQLGRVSPLRPNSKRDL